MQKQIALHFDKTEPLKIYHIHGEKFILFSKINIIKSKINFALSES